jgi:hypothetical protein
MIKGTKKKKDLIRLEYLNPDGSVLLSDLGKGGIHGVLRDKKTIIPEEGQRLFTVDVEGLYPTVSSEWDYVPKHLPGLGKVLGRMKKERAVDKKAGRMVLSDLKKLGGNGAVGMYKNSYSWLFDQQANYAICVLGQLCMLKFTEMCIAAGISVVSQNTDGCEVLCPIGKEDVLKSILDETGRIFKVTWEMDEYSAMYMLNINNYIALHHGDKEPKLKGMFVTREKKVLEDSRDFMVLPLAWKNYFWKGIPIEETIKNHDNIYDFCAAPRIDKSYQVFYGGERLKQNLNRFYPSIKGEYLLKRKDGNLEHVLKDSLVTIFNQYEKKKDYGINYNFFVSKANETINELKNNQLKLF